MTHKRYRKPEQGYSRAKQRDLARQTIENDLFGAKASANEAGVQLDDPDAAATERAAAQDVNDALGGLDLGSLVSGGPTPIARPSPAPVEERRVTQVNRGMASRPDPDQEVHKPTAAQRMIDRLLGLIRKSR